MSDSSLAGRRILVVEDEYLVATDLADELADAGVHVVGPASSVPRALALIDRTPGIDLAILDVNVGGEAVYPVADALCDRRIPFVLVTGYDRGAIPERYQGSPMLQKPVASKAVLGAVRHRLACPASDSGPDEHRSYACGSGGDVRFPPEADPRLRPLPTDAVEPPA